MDIFLTQTHPFFPEGLYSFPGAVWSTFIMDRCTFMDFKTDMAIHWHYKT